MEYQNPDHNRSEYAYGPEVPQRPEPDPEKKAIKETRQCFSRIGLIYLLFFILSNVSQLAAGVFLVWTGLAKRMGQDMYTLITIFSMYPVAVPLTAWLMKRVPSQGQPEKERWGMGKLAGFFLFSLGVLYIGNLVGTGLMSLAGYIKGEPIVNNMQELILSMEFWTVFVAVVLVAPVMEELVFRKFLLDRIAGYGHWTAMAVSGVLFGIVHGNFYQFFYAFGLGMVFAYVYLHTGRIFHTITFHMVINFTGSIVPMAMMQIARVSPVAGGLLLTGHMMLMFGYVICSVILAVLCRRDLYFHPGVVKIPPAEKNKAVWLNVGMVLFLLGGAGIFAWSM